MKNVLFFLLAFVMFTACNQISNQEQTEVKEKQEATEQPATIEVAVIDVTGMHCGACIKAVTSALTELEGVENAEVSLEDEKATVTYSSSKVSTDDFKAAIEGKGYGVAKLEILPQEQDTTNQPE